MHAIVYQYIKFNVKSLIFFIVESSITDASIDPTKYTIRRQLSGRLVLYARIVGVSF
jgi:hypothetical protein